MQATSTSSTVPRIVIVGGGAGGLALATQLGRDLGRPGRAEIILADMDAAYVWKPMLHTVAAGTYDAGIQQTAYLAQAANRHFHFMPGRMTALDRTSRRITLAPVTDINGQVSLPEREVGYDYLVLAVGSRANDFGTPGVQAYCDFIEGRREARVFNSKLRLELLRAIHSSETGGLAIIGGGATGVQLAAEVSHMLELIDGYGVPDAHAHFKLYLIEMQDYILAGFPDNVVQQATEQLAKVGVEVMTGAQVASVDAEGVSLKDGRQLPARIKVWAAGVKAPEFLHGIDGLESMRNGRLVINTQLQTRRDDRIYAIGDCAALTFPGETMPLPTTAQVANQQAKYLAEALPRRLAGQASPPFEYHDMGKIVSLSDYNAFGVLGNYGFFKRGFIKGRFAQLGHLFLYRRFQVDLYGWWRTGLRMIADRINRLSQPKVRLD